MIYGYVPKKKSLTSLQEMRETVEKMNTPIKVDWEALQESISQEFNEAVENIRKETKNERVFESGSKRDDNSNKPLVNHFDPYCRLRFGYLLRAGANKYSRGIGGRVNQLRLH